MGRGDREVINPEGLRVDGRRAKEIRRISASLSGSLHVDGSCTYEQGNTKLLVTVVGPVEAKRGKVNQDRATVTCEYSACAFSGTERKVQSKSDRRAIEMASHIRQLFSTVILTHLYPRSNIHLQVSVLSADGGALIVLEDYLFLSL